MTFGVETAVILTMIVLIVGSNIVILLVVIKTDAMSLLNRHFFVSLTVADLAVGVLVAPFSVWAAVYDRWIYGDRFCQLEACLSTALGIASVHSLAWLSVDQYVAARKPERYAAIMTPTRSACWVGVVWSTAVGFSATPLFGDAASTARYHAEAFVCAVDWTSQTAYFLTAATLVLVPPLAALVFSNAYIFTARYDRDRISYDKPISMAGSSHGNGLVEATMAASTSRSSSTTAAAAVAAASSTFVVVPSASISSESSRPEFYAVTVIVGWVHIAAWLPWCAMQLYCHFAVGSPTPTLDRTSSLYAGLARTRSSFPSSATAAAVALAAAAFSGGSGYGGSGAAVTAAAAATTTTTVGTPALHFWLAWLAIGNSFWKFIVYVLCFHDFRTGLKILYYNYIGCR